jgi:hypothetical protein
MYNFPMIFRGRLGGSDAAVSLKDSSVSVAVGEGFVVAWDLGGRLYSVFRHGQTYRRGLNGRVLHKWRDPSVAPDALSAYDERQRVILGDAESASLLDETSHLASRAVRGIAVSPEAARVLERCAGFDAAAAGLDAARFARVYAPVGILPPDQYMSTVLQATVGCSFGTCTFCDLYHEPYRVRAVPEFEQHVHEALAYLGESLSLRQRSVFLGSANALAVPMPRLLDLLACVRRLVPNSPPVHAFVDGFTGTMKDAADYRRLGALGLRRVYAGLESGCDDLLAFVRKPATSGEAVATVRAIKAGGVAVAVIVMVGLGGRAFAAEHVTATVETVNRMDLGPGDLVYFSELVDGTGEAAGYQTWEALTLPERAAQLRAIREGLVFGGAPPKFARYDIREFVY